MSHLEKTEIAEAVDKMLIRRGCDTYSIVRVGVDIQSMYIDEYINALAHLMKETRMPFENCEFLQRAIAMHEWIWPDQFYIIGGKNGRGDSHIINRTERLIQVVEQCPEGPVLERVRKDYRDSPDQTFENRPSLNGFLERIRKDGKRVLLVRNGPKYLSKKELHDIADLFLAPVLDNTNAHSTED